MNSSAENLIQSVLHGLTVGLLELGGSVFAVQEAEHRQIVGEHMVEVGHDLGARQLQNGEAPVLDVKLVGGRDVPPLELLGIVSQLDIVLISVLIGAEHIEYQLRILCSSRYLFTGLYGIVFGRNAYASILLCFFDNGLHDGFTIMANNPGIVFRMSGYPQAIVPFVNLQ